MTEQALILAIEFKSESDYTEALSVAKFEFDIVNEDFDHCIRRERGTEALACIEGGYPFLAYTKGGEVIDTNVDFEHLDRVHTQVLYRKHHREQTPIAGLTPLNHEGNELWVNYWPLLFSAMPDDVRTLFIKRNVESLPAAALAEKIASGELEERLPLFVKTLNKGINNHLTLHDVFYTAEDLEALNKEKIAAQEYFKYTSKFGNEDAPLWFFKKDSDWFCPYRDERQAGRRYVIFIDDSIVLSDYMEILKDGKADQGTKEYRCFIVGSKVSSISRYADYEHYEIPAEVKEFADRFAKMLGNDNLGFHMPPLYVLDVAETTDGCQVIELNPIENSGRYLNNDIHQLLADIQAEGFGGTKDIKLIPVKHTLLKRDQEEDDMDLKELLKKIKFD